MAWRGLRRLHNPQDFALRNAERRSWPSQSRISSAGNATDEIQTQIQIQAPGGRASPNAAVGITCRVSVLQWCWWWCTRRTCPTETTAHDNIIHTSGLALAVFWWRGFNMRSKITSFSRRFWLIRHLWGPRVKCGTYQYSTRLTATRCVLYIVALRRSNYVIVGVGQTPCRSIDLPLFRHCHLAPAPRCTPRSMETLPLPYQVHPTAFSG